jgi:hypothetical protein
MAASDANIVVTRNTNRAKKLHQEQFMLAVELLSSAAARIAHSVTRGYTVAPSPAR